MFLFRRERLYCTAGVVCIDSCCSGCCWGFLNGIHDVACLRERKVVPFFSQRLGIAHL